MTKHHCAICAKTNYQTSTVKMMYDSYCVACRGMFRYYTRTKGMTEAQANAKLAEPQRKTVRPEAPPLLPNPKEFMRLAVIGAMLGI